VTSQEGSESRQEVVIKSLGIIHCIFQLRGFRIFIDPNDVPPRCSYAFQRIELESLLGIRPWISMARMVSGCHQCQSYALLKIQASQACILRLAKCKFSVSFRYMLAVQMISKLANPSSSSATPDTWMIFTSMVLPSAGEATTITGATIEVSFNRVKSSCSLFSLASSSLLS